MTCIVGVASAGRVFIGSDSAGASDWTMVSRSDRKVFVAHGFIYGFTDSFRMGQLLRYSFVPPPRSSGKDLMAYMVVDFINALRDCLKGGGYSKIESGVERGGTFLVGHSGRLFRVEGDYQVGENEEGYDACGAGQIVAFGALHATRKKAPRHQIKAALEASVAHTPQAVRPPFHIESI